MKDQTKEHVKSCAPCKLGLAKFNEPVTMQPIAVQGIYHKVGIDMIGPIQVSLSGNKYIITAIDYMSKNIEAVAVPNKNSKTTAEFFYRDIICRHGTPVEVVTDQGGEFQGEFQIMLDKYGIDHRLTSAYHPQANGLTERANQTLTRSLIKMTKEDPLNWDKQIPTALMGYRATKQASTKYSPFFMLNGHEMVLPINNKGRTVDAQHGESSEPSLADLCGPSTAVLENALSNISEAQNKQMANYANKQLHGAVLDLVPAIELPARTPLPVSKPDLPDQNRSIVIPTAKMAPKMTPVSTAAPNIAVEPDVPANSTAVLQPDILDKQPKPFVRSKPTIAIKQEPVSQPVTRKRIARPIISEGDFVVVKIHKAVRKDGERKGKLVPKAEGPYLVKGFTDATKQIALIADANDVTWPRRVADLSKWD